MKLGTAAFLVSHHIGVQARQGGPALSQGFGHAEIFEPGAQAEVVRRHGLALPVPIQAQDLAARLQVGQLGACTRIQRQAVGQSRQQAQVQTVGTHDAATGLTQHLE